MLQRFLHSYVIMTYLPNQGFLRTLIKKSNKFYLQDIVGSLLEKKGDIVISE